MTEGTLYPRWPGVNDKIVVEEMLTDPQSGQWYECYHFVKQCIKVQANNVPRDTQEDLVQEVMIRIAKYLPTFRYRSSLTTWIVTIARSCIIDKYRKYTHEERFTILVEDTDDDTENDENADAPFAKEVVEDEYAIRDELSKALAALQEYVSTHPNPVRNSRILDMVLLEGRSLEETARAVGCSAAVVGYIVRSAQRHTRERLAAK